MKNVLFFSSMSKPSSSKLPTVMAGGLLLLASGLSLPVIAETAHAHETYATQQANTVTGTVIDDRGEPVIGATVVVKEHKGITSTDVNGRFSIRGEKGNTLIVSCIGYKRIEMTIGDGPVNLVMKDDGQSLNEAVVVGFGTQKKVNLTGSVSTVGAKDIAARPVNNVTDALQGVVAGMNFSTGSGGGALNSNKSYNIRGTGTIGAGSSVSPLVLIDGMAGDLSTLNPQDVENISVLKDASASSIYGSRAAGGVILVTTKKGKEGKTSVNYNNSFRFNSPLNMPEMANALEYAYYFNDAGNSVMFNETKIQQVKDYMAGKPGATSMYANANGQWEIWDDLNLLPTGNTDWLKTHFGNSFSQEHTLSINGGTEKVQYYFSANYLGQNGILKQADDKQQRYTVTGKVNAQLASWAKIGYSVRFNRRDYEQPSYMNDLFYHNVCRYWPIIPVTDPNGHYTVESKINQLLYGGIENDQNDDLSQQFSLTITPLAGWNINAELNYQTTNRFYHEDYQTVYGYDVEGNPFVIDNATSSVYEYGYKQNYFNPNIFTEYAHTFNEAHNFKVMAGFQSEWNRYRTLSGQQDGIIGGVPTLNTTSTNARTSGGYYSWSTAGFFGRVNYDYQGRYLLEGNIRYDGSSRFLQDKRWNWFPSFSVGWNIAREDFFESLNPYIGTLKLRASWGMLGNQNTDSWYPFYSAMGYSANAGNWLIGGKKPNIASEPTLISTSLTWEKSRTWDIGLDVTAFRNRLSLTFDYFQRKTYDMVGPAPELPDVLGAAVPKVNNLDMTSKGWELAVSWRDNIRDFSYGVSLTLADNRVVIDKYPNPSKTLSNTYYKGAYLGDIWGYTTIGIAKTDEEMNAHLQNANQDYFGANWAAGDIMYADLNGDGKVDGGEGTADSPGDRRIIGNSTPRYNFGLNIDASWKGFDLKIFFQGTLKRDYWADGPMFWGASGGKWQSVCFKEHLDYFRNDPNDPMGVNLDAYYPRADWSTSKNQAVQTRYLQNAAYARLKNVTLGYTLPAELSKKFYCQNLRVFVSGENLLTITSFTGMADPELVGVGSWGFGKTYPLSKTFSVGLSVTF